MPLNSDQMEAFFIVAKLRSFSKAAKALALSQPALSLRIKKLEERMETGLLIRGSDGISLTDAGEKVFRYYSARADTEGQLLDDIQAANPGGRESVRGAVRVAGLSTSIRSVLIPSLHELVVKHPNIQLEIHTREMSDLGGILKRSEVDFALTEGPIFADNVETLLLGNEQNVLVESKKILPGRVEVIFDNDPEDQSTFNFMRAQSQSKALKYRRSYLDEVYSIITAVEKGWGRAVLPRHLIRSNSRLRVVPGFRVVTVPIYLSFFRLPFYPALHTLVRGQIEKGFQLHLSAQ